MDYTVVNPRRRSDHSWIDHAICGKDEPDSLFVQGAAQREVRMKCMECPVRLDCLADALQFEANFGVWGGLTERERRAILRRYPEVENWALWLESSDEAVALELRHSAVPRVLSIIKGLDLKND